MTTQELKNKIEKVLGNSIRCLLPSYWWKNLFYSVADSIEEVSTSVNKLSEELSDLDNHVDITRDELFKLVQDKKLIPGRSYRIIDYECTLKPGINAYAYKENKFAIVVKALSNWELDQNARATFMPNSWSAVSKYTSWQLKYSIYNDVDKYPWARQGTIEYDAAVILDNPPDDYDKKGVVVWDSESKKYILNYEPYASATHKGDYLITSETDKTPLAQTSFNYGDIVYIYISGDVYSARISYTKAMRDSGDAVLVNEYSLSVSYCDVFKWNSEKEAYTDVLNDSIILTDAAGTTIPKRDAFTSSEIVKKSIYSAVEYLTYGFNIPDGKGVIYYLKDSDNNEAYYDFKNIAFLFPEVSSKPVFTFDFDNKDFSEGWGHVKNVKIENAGDLNYITFNLGSIFGEVLNNVVVSSKIKNQAFNEEYKNVYIGYDDNNNLSAVNIFNIDSSSLEASIELRIEGKQDTISDLDAIRSGAALGATAIQQVKTINGESIVGEGDLQIATKVELQTLQNEVIANEEVIAHAFDDVNNRLNDISENVCGTTVTKEEFETTVADITNEIVTNEEITAAAFNDLRQYINTTIEGAITNTLNTEV